MLELRAEALKNKKEWEAAEIKLPTFDYQKMVENTKEHPVWVHFGAGNIFRGFIAVLQQRLLNAGTEQSGIIAADTFDYDIIDHIYQPFDNLTLMVGLKPDGSTDMEVIGSVAQALKADSSDEKSMSALRDLFCNPELQMASFTITEKGYALYDMNKELLSVVKQDIQAGPTQAVHAMSMVTALLFERFKNGAAPIAMCSMDNCSHNGEKLKSSVVTIATEWNKNGFVSEDFLTYLQDESKVSFPWSMIDKITPRPAAVIEEKLNNLGIRNMQPITTQKNTYIAPFVNAEIPQYLVMEDVFPNGRPKLEDAGVYLTDRETVNNTERMKVTTCLNPLHTAMAVFGCLLGYDHIAKEMQDEDIKKLVERIGYIEGIPVVVNPKIIQPMDFIKEVIEQRLPNPYIPDMPQRIATDTSMKIPIRFGETIKSYVAADDKDTTDLVGISLAIAAWLRYLLAVDDNGNKMEVSSDPMLEQLQSILNEIQVGNPSSYHGQIKEILANETIFAQDLCKVGLGNRIEEMFIKMLAGKGAVRRTLHFYIA